ncbi:hypothetical protein QWJ90_12480 [Microbacterium oryzae]|uniref:hypothetical protein n=1 Tax=Microbacterium oryzae TaxID=743009 RepID=UPI0025AF85FB|nr:hypothetical protein [Microbacterium oryzae]MDN3311746.1 hypothetical protein [Microbacterium oryzae]
MDQDQAQTHTLEERQRTDESRGSAGARRFVCALVWLIPIVSILFGLTLSAKRTVDLEGASDGDSYEIVSYAVWPAGLALLQTGMLGLTAAANLTAVILTQRAAPASE